MSKKTITAGAFDIRNIIGLLLTIYGAVLTVLGVVSYDDAAAAKTGGINANLIVGIVLLVVGIFFLVWAKVRPQIVPAEPANSAMNGTAADGAAVGGATVADTVADGIAISGTASDGTAVGGAAAHNAQLDDSAVDSVPPAQK